MFFFSLRKLSLEALYFFKKWFKKFVETYRATIMILLPDANVNFKRTAVYKLVQELRYGNRKPVTLKAADFLDLITRYEELPAGVNSLKKSDSANVLQSVVGNNNSSSPMNELTSDGDVDPDHEMRVLDSACLLALCCSVQTALSPELTRLDKEFKLMTYMDEAGLMKSVASIAGGGSGAEGGSSGSSSGGGSNAGNSSGGSVQNSSSGGTTGGSSTR